MAPGGTAVSVKMTTPQKAPTVITAGGVPAAKPAGIPSAPLTSTTPSPTATAPARVTVVSQVSCSHIHRPSNVQKRPRVGFNWFVFDRRCKKT